MNTNLFRKDVGVTGHRILPTLWPFCRQVQLTVMAIWWNNNLADWQSACGN